MAQKSLPGDRKSPDYEGERRHSLRWRQPPECSFSLIMRKRMFQGVFCWKHSRRSTAAKG